MPALADDRGASRAPGAALRLRSFDRDVGLVLLAYVVLLAVENLAVGLGYRAEFVGTWEMGSARLYLSPIALAAAVPVAVAVVAMQRLALAGRVWPIALAGAVAGGALGFFTSTGRTMERVVVRAPFVAVVALVAAALAWQAARRLPRARPSVVAVGSIVVAAVAWLADAFVLPRLYPAFHLGLLGVLVVAWAGTAVVVARARWRDPLAFGAIVLASASIAWTPHAATKLRAEDNLRRVLLEKAPVLGRAVVIASRLAPPLPLEDDDAATTTLTSLRSRAGTRALDWTGRDIVLVTIDALRADHVSAYGYARKTTPNIDALAAEGVRFEAAYCPTPHTSYSIASMMTGKYMKPLLALTPDADEAGETWALALRRYGYRTAAFYPPAVFFIDAHRFRRMEEEHLGFEYYKAEFADLALRRAQVARFLDETPRDHPVFVWVHLFEPHEPYEMHEEHPFSGDPRVDAYDSEIAAADAFVGDLVKLIADKRSAEAVFVISADHGEEHGDHGGRYHGTTVYEEQVRVPLVVRAPGLPARVVTTPVQTIDLLPTTLAALDVPVAPRIRGRDLGPILVGSGPPADEGLAFAETDDYTLVARGHDRLVCARKIGSCTLFDVSRDPAQTTPVADRPERVLELRRLTAAIERETGKVEASTLPDALRRGLQGDRDAAEDVAPLLDDARVDIRRTAARCAFRLRAPEMVPALRRAHERDEDEQVRRFALLALARLGEAGGADVGTMLEDQDAELRFAAALVLGENGDPRGEGELLARWTSSFAPDARTPGELDEARELLAALGKLRSRGAVAELVRSLDDVRLRPYVVEALAAIGDTRAKEPLLRAFSAERYVHLRPLEARALLDLGAQKELAAPLARFAGTPEPMLEAITIAREAKILTPERGGADWPAKPAPPAEVTARVRLDTEGPARLLVLGAEPAADVEAKLDGVEVPRSHAAGAVHVFEAGERRAGAAQIALRSSSGVLAAWLVPHAPEIPPPPPEEWTPEDAADAGL